MRASVAITWAGAEPRKQASALPDFDVMNRNPVGVLGGNVVDVGHGPCSQLAERHRSAVPEVSERVFDVKGHSGEYGAVDEAGFLESP